MKPLALTPFALALAREHSRAETVADLRRLLPKLEGATSGKLALSFGLAGIDAHLPGGGLAAGALHEVVAEAEGDLPSAFGFLAALAGRMLEQFPTKREPVRRRTGGSAGPIGPRSALEAPVLFIASPRGLAGCGAPHGHGLNGLGLDPARLILVETRDEVQALWAMEEALRSGVPAAVAAAIGKELDLKTSRRLHLAAGHSGVPLLLLRAAGATGSSAATTRWRIGAASAAPDRFGLPAGWRWRLRLERCRNGRLGEWLVEWDHAAYRFSLAAPMADPALPRSASAPPLRFGTHRS